MAKDLRITTTGGISAAGGLSACADPSFFGGNVGIGVNGPQGALHLADDCKILLGNSSDLQLFHDTSQGTSFISDQGTGNLHIQSDSQIRLESFTGTEKYARFFLNGCAEIYFNNAVKFETTSTGSKITGSICATNDANFDGDLTSRDGTFRCLDISSDVDIDGTLETDGFY